MATPRGNERAQVHVFTQNWPQARRRGRDAEPPGRDQRTVLRQKKAEIGYYPVTFEGSSEVSFDDAPGNRGTYFTVTVKTAKSFHQRADVPACPPKPVIQSDSQEYSSINKF
ncbi:hypothetical protein EVAR_18253_1 [Eumeta japonica]|uniref:Uncharacterized protein n=1 Tax=Eumeta variegata TaxID=151549 RepID=A0A4C1UKX4_EUMVA|nr:hypothetical protein EVAR_18253_1 [Eumeta japonica]